MFKSVAPLLRSTIFRTDLVLTTLLAATLIAGAIARDGRILLIGTISGLALCAILDILWRRVLLLLPSLTVVGALLFAAVAPTHHLGDALAFGIGTIVATLLTERIRTRTLQKHPHAAGIMPSIPLGDVIVSTAAALLFGPYFVLIGTLLACAVVIAGLLAKNVAERSRPNIRLPFAPCVVGGTAFLTLCVSYGSVPDFVRHTLWLPIA